MDLFKVYEYCRKATKENKKRTKRVKTTNKKTRKILSKLNYND